MRLSRPHLLEGHTEIAVPTRFVTILLRSASDGGDVKEIARCFATLMSDDVFRCRIIEDMHLVTIFLYRSKEWARNSFFFAFQLHQGT